MTQITCDGLLFDLDGVLIDSTPAILHHWTYWADMHQLDIRAIMQISHGMRTIETMRQIAPHLDVEKEAREFTAREVAETHGVVAIAGANELLRELPDDAWAIVTSASLDLAKARLTRAGLPIPKTMVTADQVLRGKPDPEPYLLGAKRLDLSVDQCVVIEDAPAGIIAGRRAGMRVIGVQSTHSREELLANGVSTIANNLTHLRVSAAPSHGRLLIEIESDKA